MIPQGAPTTWFSASWQSVARRRGSIGPAPRAPRGGDLERRARRHPDRLRYVRRHREAHRRRCDHAVTHEYERNPEDVVGPARAAARRRRRSGVGELRQCRGLRDGELRRAHDERAGRLREHGRHEAGRDLEHQCTRVVGDATQQVEATGRATGARAHRRAPRGPGRSAPASAGLA